MPSLIRFLVTLAILAGIAYGVMYALTVYVEPREREVTIRLPSGQLELRRLPPPAPPPSVEPAVEGEEPASE